MIKSNDFVNNHTFLSFSRVISGHRTGALAQLFTKSESNTIWNDIFVNLMSENSFHSNDFEATQTLLKTNELLTQYSEIDSMIKNSEPCKIKILWEAPFKDQSSIAFPKGSPLVPFFKNGYSKIRQTGTLFRLREKWKSKISEASCESRNNLNPITFEIIVSLTPLIMFGIFTALILLAIERSLPKIHRNPNELLNESSRVTSSSITPVKSIS